MESWRLDCLEWNAWVKIDNSEINAYDTSEFISSSSGVADAGKPIVLDSTGKIDSSMYVAGASTGTDVTLTTSNFNGILSGSNTHVQSALETLDDHAHTATQTSVVVTSFGGILSGSNTTVQSALETIDDHTHSAPAASSVTVSAGSFTGVLDTTDTNVQLALTKIDGSNATAQWNADKIQGKTVNSAAIDDGYVLS